MINYFKSSLLLAKHIKSTGAFTETSKFVAKEITNYVSVDKAQTIIEMGAGNGNITKVILDKMHINSKLICFELNPDFCANMKAELLDDRLLIVNDSAENFDKYLNQPLVDLIISTLPFTIFPKKSAHSILTKTKQHLIKNGHFSQVYYSLFFLKEVRHHFIKNQIKLAVNFPPAFIIHSTN